MKLGKTVYLKNRQLWRKWLEKNHKKMSEIWLVFPKSHTRKPRVAYPDAVEEALCFGWIDSIAKRIDEDSFAQRFSPRKPRSNWSQANLERVRRLKRLGLMDEAGLAALPSKSLSKKKFEISQDILKALKKDLHVWRNFQKFPASYKRIRVAFIEGRRRHGALAFRKSLKHFVAKSKENKRFAFGGVQE